jgi:pSer/pThr/pTyr-binding forkhead associated (FHA) protein
MGAILQLTLKKSGKTREFELKGSRITIGRDSHNVISVDLSAVSARHAVITQTPHGEYLLEDCDSKNGTFLNQTRVTSSPVPFKAGDVIRIAQVVFEVTEKIPANAIAVIPLNQRKKDPKK